MSNSVITGLYGKLPSHGDFIYRNLPTSFINAWDDWLQTYISISQDKLQNAWLDVYLTRPIWRFVLSPGAMDINSWAGIMIPSVDRVGRYFPFTVLAKIPGNTNLLHFISSHNNWFEKIEELAITALDGVYTAEELMAEIEKASLSVNTIPSSIKISDLPDSIVIDYLESSSINELYPSILDLYFRNTMPSFSVWSTSGSEYVNRCMFVVHGMPSQSGLVAMMDGQWNKWNWNNYCNLAN